MLSLLLPATVLFLTRLQEPKPVGVYQTLIP